MQDSEIVELYLARDEKAISETKTKYERYLMKIAQNILYDIEDSRESVNDTYLAAWNSIPPNKPSVLAAYLGKLARRISIDLFRKKTSTKRIPSQYSTSIDELSDCLQDSHNTEKEVDSKLLAKAISDFLRTLPEKSRVLFVGRYYYLDSLKSVAEYSGISESAAKSALFRIRKDLAEYLTKEGFDI